MASEAGRARTIEGLTPQTIPYDALMEAQTPAILKGVARDWPLVRRGLEGPDAAIDYITSFYRGGEIAGYTGAPEGRYFYNDDLSGLNFTGERVALDSYLARMKERLDDPEAPVLYAGSVDADRFLPGFRAENDLPLTHAIFAGARPIVSLWIGTRSTTPAHYDMSNNLACTLVGRRRFTLFPPEEVANLYPGPLEPTPGGQVVSMVDLRRPDLERYPRYREAMKASLVAELEPGDVLFYPALWWHQVEALEPFNAMMNYWWNAAPAFLDTPQNTLLHALLSLRDRPEAEKQAWRALFDYYVFGSAETPRAHLPEHAQGNLAPLDELKARRLRAMLLNRLNR